jgi:uncharacterized protein (DUF2384 family)
MSVPFKRKARGPILSRDQGLRQSRAVRIAQAALHSTDAVRTFLNSYHAGLRGRPLDLAVASPAGLLAVESAIAAHRLAAVRSP